MNFSSFQDEARIFLRALFADLRRHGIAIEAHWDIDHLCYRTPTLARYQELKSQFAAFADLLIESPVNGRAIATYRLHTPVVYEEHRIDVVELPAPKPSKPSPEGFEHIEVVCDIPFAELEEKYAHLPLDRGGLQKELNQELEIALGTRNVKFHHLSLASVIRVEANNRVHSALQRSQILKNYRAHHPLVAGTFPLGIATKDSDLDILMQAQDLDALAARLAQDYANSPSFQCVRATVDALPTLIVSFEFDNVPFEVFAQDRPSVTQRAYRHLLVEERLLKYGGHLLQEKVQRLREQGMKTEPAFATALGLSTDPYEALLSLQKSPLSHGLVLNSPEKAALKRTSNRA